MGERYDYLVCVDDALIGSRVILQEFPELQIRYSGTNNTTGIVSLTFYVNGHTLVLNSDDNARHHTVVLGEYEFVGKSVRIRNQLTSLLLFGVTRYVSGGNDSGAYGTETRTYRVGTVFTLEFTESSGTGHTYLLKLPSDGIVQLENTYTQHFGEIEEDYQGPGRLNTHRFTLKAMASGVFLINLVYTRHWERTEKKQQVGRKTRQYIVTIVQ